MPRVLFYIKHLSMLPNWVDPVAPYLEQAGYDAVVLHASSLNRDTSRSGEEDRSGYRTIELAELNIKTITATISDLAPSAIVMYTFRSLVDLLLIRVARDLNLPSIYIQHGFYVSTKFQMPDKRASFYRYRHFIRWYLAYLMRKRPGDVNRELKILFDTLFQVDYRLTPFDFALFYSPAGYRDADQYFGFSDTRVFYSGYPIVPSDRDWDRLVSANTGKKPKNVMYIHQPFIIDKFTHMDYEAEFEFLSRLAQACRNQDHRLLIKIHPRESIDRYRQGVPGADILGPEAGISDTLCRCRLMIGHFSTALFNGVLLGVPVVLLDYPGLDRKYYSFFKTVGIPLARPEGLEPLLTDRQLQNSRLELYEDFIQEFVGTNNSYQHQAETLLGILKKAEALSA